MLKKLFLAFVAAVAVLLVWAALRPDHFSVQRSVVVAAAPEAVYPLVSDLRAFNRWNPFAAQDPAIKIEYEALTAGPGAAYRWTGEKAGAGRMAITEAVAPTKVLVALDFTAPMEGHNTVEFSLVPQGPGRTQVTWAMRGPMPYLNRLVTIFFDMDAMVGGQFESGLAALKALAEKP